MHAIGIDVGGTKIFAALVSKKGAITKSIKVGTPKSKKKLIETLSSCVKALQGHKKVSSAGIAIAGVLDGKKSVLLKSPNMPFLNNWKLKGCLSKKFGMRVKVENDANCFAIAAHRVEAPKAKNMAVLTLGTGVGCGLILNGRLYTGGGRASEFGHTKFLIESGKAVEAEKILGSKGILKMAKEKGINAKGVSEISEKAKKSRKASKVMGEAGKNIGILTANLFDTLDLEIVALCGGVSNPKNRLLAPAKKSCAKSRFIPGKKTLYTSALWGSGGAVGAALNAMKS